MDQGIVEHSTASREVRSWPLAEVRLQSTDDGGERITGYAAVFNAPSETLTDGFGFSWTEKIRAGAFAKTLQEQDVRALVNHDSNYVLGRNKSGTLEMLENRKGLYVEIAPPDTVWARDLKTSMKRGDVSQMSFAFQIIRERWTENSEERSILRELLEVQLYDVSVVTFPAYPQTSAVVRSAWEAMGIDTEALSGALLRTRAGLPPSCSDGDCLRAAIAALSAQLPQEPALTTPVDVSLRKRELDIAERRFALI